MSTKTPPPPDNRLPFRGRYAFDRNSQKYVAFETETDAMLASLVLAYRLAPPILSLVLALVRHPSFNPADITLSNPEDVWEHASDASLTNLPLEQISTCRTAFPRVVFEEVIDIFQTERRAKLHHQRDTDGPVMGRINYSETDRDLRSMSLVCKSWTTRSQRALGKVLALQDVRKEQVTNALNGPLFGKWTKEAVVFRHNRELDDKGREALFNEGNEVWGLMAALFARAPNISTVSLCSDWFEMPSITVVRGLCRLPSLLDLRFVLAGDIAPLLGAVCKHIHEMARLQHLSLQYSGNGSAYSSFVPPSELPLDGPAPSFEKLSLKIGTSSPTALRYITWITQPRDGESSFRLKSLSIDLSRGHYSERPAIEALEPCLHGLEALTVNVTGLGDGVLERILQASGSLKQLTLVIRHNFVNGMAHGVPSSLEQYILDFSLENPDFIAWDARVAAFIRDRAPAQLQRLVVRPMCYHRVGSVEDIFLESRRLARERGLNALFQFQLTAPAY